MLNVQSEAAVAFMRTVANPDGGWGYRPGGASSVEPTCAALLALSEGENAAERAGAIAWLLAAQNPDGGWGLTAGDEQSGWQTAWALLALTPLPQHAPQVERGVAWQLAVELAPTGTDDTQQTVRTLFGMDASLVGWPWLPGQASFVEPTAFALLALSRVGRAGHPRVPQGVAYLLDRRCNGGGWNVGNPRMFSEFLPPRASTTALALLALAALSPERIDPGDIKAMKSEMAREASPSALALGLLALRAAKSSNEESAALLRGMQQADGSWNGSPFETALAIAALGKSDL